MLTFIISGNPMTPTNLLIAFVMSIAISLALTVLAELIHFSILIITGLYKIAKIKFYHKYGFGVEFDTSKYPDIKLDYIIDELKKQKIKYHIDNSDDFYNKDLEVMLHKIGYVYQFYFLKKENASFFKLRWG